MKTSLLINRPAFSLLLALTALTQSSLAATTLVGWGDNYDGQTTVPAELSDVVAIAGGSHHSLALVGEQAPVQIGAPMRLTDPIISFRVSLLTRRGATYRLEYKDALEAGSWKLLPPLPGDGTQKTLTDPAPLVPHRFYRVRAQ